MTGCMSSPGRKFVARCSRRVLGTEGAAIVEIAVCSAVLLALTIGVVEMSMALYACHVTADAARQASRWAMVRGSSSCANTPNLTDCGATAAQIQDYVSSLGYLNIGASDTTVSWLKASKTEPTTWSACAGTCNDPGNQVRVVVTYPFPLSIPFVSAQTLSVTSQSQVVISQ